MAKVLAGIKGRFVFSLNDRPQVREIFSEFLFVDASLTYLVGGGKGVDAQEVIILDRKVPRPANV